MIAWSVCQLMMKVWIQSNDDCFGTMMYNLWKWNFYGRWTLKKQKPPIITYLIWFTQASSAQSLSGHPHSFKYNSSRNGLLFQTWKSKKIHFICLFFHSLFYINVFALNSQENKHPLPAPWKNTWTNHVESSFKGLQTLNSMRMQTVVHCSVLICSLLNPSKRTNGWCFLSRHSTKTVEWMNIFKNGKYAHWCRKEERMEGERKVGRRKEREIRKRTSKKAKDFTAKGNLSSYVAYEDQPGYSI